MTTMETYGRALVEQTALFADTAAAGAVDAPVPTCLGWTMRELVEHLGQTQHWVASMVEDRAADPSQLPTSFSPLPTDPAGWSAWLADGASRLATACLDAEPDAPVWNPSGDGRTGTQFWLRRIVAETVIHRADAAAAAGVTYELDPGLAADVITDQLAMLTSPAWPCRCPPRQQRCAATARPCTCMRTTAPATGSSNAAPKARPGSTDAPTPT